MIHRIKYPEHVGVCVSQRRVSAGGRERFDHKFRGVKCECYRKEIVHAGVRIDDYIDRSHERLRLKGRVLLIKSGALKIHTAFRFERLFWNLFRPADSFGIDKDLRNALDQRTYA